MVDSVRLYRGRLKGAARYCDFNLTAGQTSYKDKMILHNLVQEPEYAAMAKEVIEEYAINNYLQNRVSLDKIEENTKMSLIKLFRNQVEPHMTTNKVSDYCKVKNLELQKRRDNLRRGGGTPGRCGTQPETGPTRTICGRREH